MLAISLLAIILGTVSPYCTNTLGCFKSKLFNFDSPPQNFYPGITIFSEQHPQFTTMSYGDFNNDYRTDIIALDNSTRTVYVYLWNNDNSAFDQSYSFAALSNSSGIILYDVNVDGLLDFIIYSSNSTNGQLTTFLQQTEGNTGFSPLGLCVIDPVQPFLVDLKVNSQQQLVAMNSGNRTILNYSPYDSPSGCPFKDITWSTFFSENTNFNVPFTVPHYNSFLDYTGDCQADIVITSANGTNTNIEFWTKIGSMYSLVQTQQVPAATFGSFSFSDINYDGGIDMVMVNNSIITIYYNNVTLSGWNDFCASKFINFPYSFSDPALRSVVALPNFTIPPLNQAIHLADINNDGYPDLLIPLINDQGTELPYILHNQAFGKSNQIDLRTFFNPQNISVNNPLYLSFFDFLENGIYDLMIIDSSYNLFATYNNFKNPNFFFIKGYCMYGPTNVSLYSGASFFWVNTIDSSQKFTHIPQLFQTAYNAMQLPYVLNGLGRANNYVQQFYIGISGNATALHKYWTPIIPNSQLIVQSNTSPDTWSIKIFVLPTDSIVYVVIVTIVLLVILGGVLIGFYWKGKKTQPEFLT